MVSPRRVKWWNRSSSTEGLPASAPSWIDALNSDPVLAALNPAGVGVDENVATVRGEDAVAARSDDLTLVALDNDPVTLDAVIPADDLTGRAVQDHLGGAADRVDAVSLLPTQSNIVVG